MPVQDRLTTRVSAFDRLTGRVGTMEDTVGTNRDKEVAETGIQPGWISNDSGVVRATRLEATREGPWISVGITHTPSDPLPARPELTRGEMQLAARPTTELGDEVVPGTVVSCEGRSAAEGTVVVGHGDSEGRLVGAQDRPQAEAAQERLVVELNTDTEVQQDGVAHQDTGEDQLVHSGPQLQVVEDPPPLL